MDNERLLLIGCGILHKEIRWLIDKNSWPIDTFFLNSALHINFEKLSEQLTRAFATHRGRETVVFYGACHPLMEGILKKGNTFRTEGQNCVDILLGNTLFSEELAKGAFFLLEDWAHRWEYITQETLGTNIELIREIYQGDRNYLLCLKTPCSKDFSAEAKAAGALVGLPIRWMDVELDHLESVLQDTITRKMRELECRR